MYKFIFICIYICVNKTCILDHIRDKLQDALGVRVIRAGIGNKVYSFSFRKIDRASNFAYM